MEKRTKLLLNGFFALALLIPGISENKGGHGGGHHGGHRGHRNGHGHGHRGRGHHGRHGRHGGRRYGHGGRNWGHGGWGWWGYGAAFWGPAVLTTAVWATWPRQRFYSYYDNAIPVLNRSRQTVVIYSGGTPEIELAPGEKAYMPSGQKIIIRRADGTQVTTENLSSEYYIE